jgi:glycosyltransferase involved in cell wall biosynthesis
MTDSLNKINIKIVTQNYFPALGGTSILMQELAERLSKYFPVEVLTFPGYNTSLYHDPNQPSLPIDPNEKVNGISVKRFKVVNKYHKFIRVFSKVLYKFKLPFWPNMKFLEYGPISPEFKKYLRTLGENDVILASSYPLNFMHNLVKIKREVGFKLVIIPAIHPIDTYFFSNPLIYSDMDEADLISVHTSYEKDYIETKGVKTKTIVPGIGLDFDVINKLNIRDIKQEIGISNDDALISYIGSHGPAKGINNLINAFDVLAQDHRNIYLIIGGATTDYTKVLKDQIESLSEEVKKRISMMNDIDEDTKFSILKSSDIFVSVSGYESFGITYIEAWSQKTPVVSTRNGSIPYVVDEFQNGLLINYQDEEELAQALKELVDNKEYREKLGENGFQKLNEKYLWKDIIPFLISNINDLFDENTKTRK